MLKKLFLSALLLIAASIAPAIAATSPTVTIGVITLVSTTPIYIAQEKGYFHDAGIDVQVEPIESTGSAMPLLAQNRLQLLFGGFSAAYWNALGSNLPLIIAFDGASSPTLSELLVRTDLAKTIKGPADLKGHSIGANAPGAIPVYQIAKMLETAGLSLKDVDVKYIPLPQMSIALGNQALDTAEMSPPLNSVAIQQKVAVHLLNFDDVIRPQPVALAGFVANTDWIKQDRQQAQKFFLALARAGRDFCQAFHHGPNRDEVEDIMVKYKTVRDRELAESIPWTSRDPNGHVSIASIEDIQDVFFKEGLVKQKFPTNRLVDTSFADEVTKQLGPFVAINKDDKQDGCR